MTKADKQLEAVRVVRAHRISTGGADVHPVEERIGVVRESVLRIDVDGLHTFSVMCTPEDREALAVGFLFSEGVIDGMAEVIDVVRSPDQPDLVHVRLSGKVPRIGERGRSLLVVSSCGACGDEDLDARISAFPPVDDTLRIDAGQLRSVGEALCERQELFGACGGTHAVGLFDERGEILSFAEDAGRHTALDKAIGKCLMNGIRTPGRGAALSGRVSLEMVGKCARAGIELITAVSAPTSLGVEVADRWNITLCAFVRETRATVFTHPARVIGLRD